MKIIRLISMASQILPIWSHARKLKTTLLSSPKVSFQRLSTEMCIAHVWSSIHVHEPSAKAMYIRIDRYITMDYVYMTRTGKHDGLLVYERELCGKDGARGDKERRKKIGVMGRKTAGQTSRHKRNSCRERYKERKRGMQTDRKRKTYIGKH